MNKSPLNALFLLTILFAAQPAFARGGLSGVMEDVGDQIGSGGSGDSSSSDTSSSSAPVSSEPAPPPAPASPAPPAPFYPGADAVYTTVDPLVGDSRGLVRMPDGSMKFVEKDVNGNVTSEVPVPAADAEKFKPTEPGGTVDLEKLPDGTWEVRQYDQDGNLVSVDPLSGQEKPAPAEEPAPPAARPAARARELPSASSTDPETGITTTSQGNEDGSRTVTKTDASGKVISEETVMPGGQRVPGRGPASDKPSGDAGAASHGPASAGEGASATRNSDSRAERTASAPDTSSSQSSQPVVRPAESGPAAPADGTAAPQPRPNPVPDGPLGADAPPPAAPRESVLDEIEESDRAAAAERPLTPTQAGRNVEQAGREGRVEANPADWERDAAAGMGAALGADSPEEAAALAARNRQHQDDMTQPRRDAAASADLQRRMDDARVRAEESARQERAAAADRAGLETRRHNAEEELQRYEHSLDEKLRAEGRTNLTEEEFAERERREARFLELSTLTPEEQAEIDRNDTVRQQVINNLDSNARNYGLRSDEATAERADNERMSDAATRGWRDYTFAGRMTSEMRGDMFNQREQGIVNNSKVEAAQNYLRRRDLTPEQRRAAEQYLAQHVMARGHNAEAILYDGAVVTTGVAADVATLAVGGTVSRGAARVFGTEAAVAGAEAGAQGGRAVPAPRATAPAPAPPVVRPPAAVGEAAGEAASRTPSQIARAEAENAVTNIERPPAPPAPAPRVSAPEPASPPPPGHLPPAEEAALRAQNMAREAAIRENALAAQRAAEAEGRAAVESGTELTPRQATSINSKIQAGNLQTQLTEAAAEARRAGVPERQIQEAVGTPVGHEVAGRSAAHDAIVELQRATASRQGTLMAQEAAQRVMQTATRVQTGQAAAAEEQFLRGEIQAAREAGKDYFEELAKKGTVGNGGFENVLSEQSIEALRRFARSRGLTE